MVFVESLDFGCLIICLLFLAILYNKLYEYVVYNVEATTNNIIFYLPLTFRIVPLLGLSLADSFLLFLAK